MGNRTIENRRERGRICDEGYRVELLSKRTGMTRDRALQLIRTQGKGGEPRLGEANTLRPQSLEL